MKDKFGKKEIEVVHLTEHAVTQPHTGVSSKWITGLVK